jgi:hypothetical protein
MTNLAKTLARQAGAISDRAHHIKWISGSAESEWRFTDDQLDEYYRLLVAECARVIESEPLTNKTAADFLRRKMFKD